MKRFNLKRSAASAVGILFCYNEEHLLIETIKHYLDQGIDLVIVDNDSTDSSIDIVEMYRGRTEVYPGRIIDVIHVKTDGYEWIKIIKIACDYMHEKLRHYCWIMLIDADAFYYSPIKKMPLLKFLTLVRRLGFNVIQGRLYDFYPTEKDDPAVSSPLERLKYCSYQPEWFNRHQERIFMYHPTVNFYASAGHQCLREGKKVCDIAEFIYKHYPWVSYEHGLKKIFSERKPRYVKEELQKQMHIQYATIQPTKSDLVCKSGALSYFFIDKETISLYAMLRDYYKKVPILLKFVVALKKVIRTAVRRPSPEVYLKYFPTTYHFLMTNFCNARCLFCNQTFEDKENKEISLESFRAMASNIPAESAKVFYFSGGGDPLLSKDLFPIMRDVNSRFPWIELRIRTNGLLLERHAQVLAEIKNCVLEISIHGREEMNDTILGRKGTKGIIDGIRQLNQHLKANNNGMRKVFYFCASRINLGEIPAMIEIAAHLKVDEINVDLCQVLSHRIGDRLRIKDSLIFHRHDYDRMIKKSEKLAKKLGVCFNPQTLDRSERLDYYKRCRYPWGMMAIDWNGLVYPCCGGEMIFKKKVKS
ncbi:MAG: hypothetical protein COT00_01755, partial [Candidatus Omnitrophica bacterium CG07_land_8_20_14_0_80_50_8]